MFMLRHQEWEAESFSETNNLPDYVDHIRKRVVFGQKGILKNELAEM
jgi:hypothetical protein